MAELVYTIDPHFDLFTRFEAIFRPADADREQGFAPRATVASCECGERA